MRKQSNFIRKIFDIAPQMDAYNEAVDMQYWLPYITYATYPVIRTDVINTDNYGLRHSLMADQTVVSLNDCPDGNVSLILGGSTVFGVGATSDAGTMASELCRLSGKTWLNFGVRSHTIAQNLVFLLFHQHLLKPVDDIVLVMGVNDLSSFTQSLVFPTVYGVFPNFTKYMDQMNPGFIDHEADCLRYPDNFADAGAFVPIGNPVEDQHLLIDHLRHILSAFQVLAKGLDARLSLVIQPVAGWHNRPLIAKEKLLIRLASKLIEIPQLYEKQAFHYHDWWGEAIMRTSTELDIPCTDLNALFTEGFATDSWLFIDDCHMTDEGYQLCAGHIFDTL